jgi:hypothetical protein
MKGKAKKAVVDNEATAIFYGKEKDADIEQPSSIVSSNASILNKNTIYIYKDGSSARVCYDGKDPNYVTIRIS